MQYLLEIWNNNQFAQAGLITLLVGFGLRNIKYVYNFFLNQFYKRILTVLTFSSQNYNNLSYVVQDYFIPYINKKNYSFEHSFKYKELGYGSYFIWNKFPYVLTKTRVDQANKHYDQIVIYSYFDKNIVQKLSDHQEKMKDKNEISIYYADAYYNRKIKDYYLYTENQNKLYENCKQFFLSGREKESFLLYGPPGTGKSQSVIAIAHKLKKDIIIISIGKETSLKELSNSILNARDSIILLEDIDRIKLTHQTNNDDDNFIISQADLLNILDCVISIQNCIIIGTTNNIEKLDPALIRHGRFSNHINFSLPSEQDLKNIQQDFNLKPNFVLDSKNKNLSEIIASMENYK